MWDLANSLERIGARGLSRRAVAFQGKGVRLRQGGRERLVFASNDYLGLSGDPAVIAAYAEAARRHGAGSGAAHLVTGHRTEHARLEEELAEFLERDRVLLFSTGYMANLGAVGALLGRGDAIYQDRLNHASLLDAGRLSGARCIRYAHTDCHHLALRMTAGEYRNRLVVTDGIFSMDGDIAPLDRIHQVVCAEGAALMVDDAHGIGVVGAHGRGTVETFGFGQNEVPLLVGTLGKAFGTFGAFVAGAEPVIETLIHKARTYIYTTASPPAVAAASRMALRIVQREPWRRERLMDLIRRFRTGANALGLPVACSQTPIQPLIVGDTERALVLSRLLMARDIVVPAIRPPTVPVGGARLRITLSAGHEESDVDRLLDGLATAWSLVGP